MSDLSGEIRRTLNVGSFQELVSTPFDNCVNAIGWTRSLVGDFSEIVDKFKTTDNITLIEEHDLFELELSEEGHFAREALLNDLRLLKAHGASPSLNLISCYDRDDTVPFFFN